MGLPSMGTGDGHICHFGFVTIKSSLGPVAPVLQRSGLCSVACPLPPRPIQNLCVLLMLHAASITIYPPPGKKKREKNGSAVLLLLRDIKKYLLDPAAPTAA